MVPAEDEVVCTFPSAPTRILSDLAHKVWSYGVGVEGIRMEIDDKDK